MTDRRSLIVLILVVVFLLGTAIAAASLLPIYTDEVAYKIFLERYWFNGGLRQSVTPFCQEGFLYAPPALLRPAAAFWALPYALGSGWASYRLLPLLALIGILYTLLAQGWRQRSASAILTVTLIGAGAALYGLVDFRPEVLVLFFALVLYLIFRRLTNGPTLESAALWSAGALLAYSAMCYLHPKALYLAPFVLVGFGVTAFRMQNRGAGTALGGVCIAISILITADAATMHKAQFLSCAEEPEIAAALSRQSVNLLEALSSVKGFENALDRFAAPQLTARGFAQIGFNSTPDVGYLPKPPATLLVAAASLAAQIAIGAAFLLGLWMVVETPFRLRTERAAERGLAALFWLGLIAPYLLSLTRNWYDAAGFSGAVALTTSLFLAQRLARPVRAVIAGLSVAAAAASLAVILTVHVPAFLHGYAGPGVPLSVDRAAVDRAVHALLSTNGVPENAPLIVDDLTYEAAKHHPMVLPITYLGIGMQRPTIVVAALKRVGAEYGVTRTAYYGLTLAHLPGAHILQTLKTPSGESISLFALKATSGSTP